MFYIQLQKLFQIDVMLIVDVSLQYFCSAASPLAFNDDNSYTWHALHNGGNISIVHLWWFINCRLPMTKFTFHIYTVDHDCLGINCIKTHNPVRFLALFVFITAACDVLIFFQDISSLVVKYTPVVFVVLPYLTKMYWIELNKTFSRRHAKYVLAKICLSSFLFRRRVNFHPI